MTENPLLEEAAHAILASATKAYVEEWAITPGPISAQALTLTCGDARTVGDCRVREVPQTLLAIVLDSPSPLLLLPGLVQAALLRHEADAFVLVAPAKFGKVTLAELSQIQSVEDMAKAADEGIMVALHLPTGRVQVYVQPVRDGHADGDVLRINSAGPFGDLPGPHLPATSLH